MAPEIIIPVAAATGAGITIVTIVVFARIAQRKTVKEITETVEEGTANIKRAITKAVRDGH